VRVGKEAQAVAAQLGKITATLKEVAGKSKAPDELAGLLTGGTFSTGGQESIWILAHTEGTAREPDGRDVVAGGIVVCGNLVQDVLVHPVRAPLHWGATEIAETIAQHLGGNGGTTSYTLGKLGVPVKLMSLVGRDAAGEGLMARLRSAGVDTFAGGNDRYADVSRALSGWRGRAARHPLPVGAPARGRSRSRCRLMREIRIFHLAAVFRMAELRRRGPAMLRAAKEAGLGTSVDTQWDHEASGCACWRRGLPIRICCL